MTDNPASLSPDDGEFGIPPGDPDLLWQVSVENKTH
jgi:hypothetical protein